MGKKKDVSEMTKEEILAIPSKMERTRAIIARPELFPVYQATGRPTHQRPR